MGVDIPGKQTDSQRKLSHLVNRQTSYDCGILQGYRSHTGFADCHLEDISELLQDCSFLNACGIKEQKSCFFLSRKCIFDIFKS